jgi:uncharacterized membrane protein YkoI
MRRRLALSTCLIAASLLLTAGAPTRADDIDHDQALRLLQKGSILPLTEIAARVKSKVPGKVLKVELETDDGVYVYEFKILRPNGLVQEVEADAATGKILKIEDDD